MGRWVSMVGLAALLAACGTVNGMVAPTPDREVLGVHAAQPAEPGATEVQPQAQAQLEWERAQICTNGYDMMGQDIEAAENRQQIVDWQFRCSPYRLSILGLPLAGWWPPYPWPFPF